MEERAQLRGSVSLPSSTRQPPALRPRRGKVGGRRNQGVVALASKTLQRKSSQTYCCPHIEVKKKVFEHSRNKIILMPMISASNDRAQKRMHINERIDLSRRGELQVAGPEQIDQYDKKKAASRGLHKDIEVRNKRICGNPVMWKSQRQAWAEKSKSKSKEAHERKQVRA